MEHGSTWSYFIDQYGSTIPIVVFLMFVQFVLAEALLSKFKCQQHFKFNFMLLNGGFLGTIYIIHTYFTLDATKITKGLICLPSSLFNPLIYS